VLGFIFAGCNPSLWLLDTDKGTNNNFMLMRLNALSSWCRRLMDFWLFLFNEMLSVMQLDL